MSTNQFRRYLDLLNEADLVPPNTNVALPSSGTFSNDDAIANLNQQMSGGTVPRCAVCGTPQSKHQQLKHQFVAGGAADRPDPVPQPQTAGGSDVGRIRQLQAELKAAGANLGATGPNRDGIDGDIGPLTTAAMTQYPDIAAKYADLRDAPAVQSATPAVNTAPLITALSAIETIIAKYKGKTKVSESRIYEADPPLSPDPGSPAATSQSSSQRTMPRLSEDNLTPAQQAALRAGIGIPRLATAPPTTSSWASRIGQKIVSKLPGLGARTAAKAGVTAAAGPLAPLVGLAATAYTIWDIGRMLYDVYKDSKNLEGMNDADQSVIKQNLAVVMSFMKDPKIANALPPDIQNRIAIVFKDLHDLAVDTGYDAPAATPTAPAATSTTPAQPAADTPAQASTPATREADVQDTLNKINALMKKSENSQSLWNQYGAPVVKKIKDRLPENVEVESLTEQLARHRDIVTEGIPWTKAGAAAKAAKEYADDVLALRRSSGLTGPALDNAISRLKVPPKEIPVSDIAANLGKKVALKTAWYGTMGALAYYSLPALWDHITAPPTISAAEKAEFNQLRDKLHELIPDVATLNSLSPEVQQQFRDFADQLADMDASAKQQSQGNK